MTVLASALAANMNPLRAQDTNEVEQLKRQLQQMQENFEKVEAEQQRQIAALKQQIEAMAQQQNAATNVTVISGPTNAVSPGLFQELSDKVDRVVEAQKKTLPSEFNPAIGLVGETVIGYRTSGNQDTGSDRPGGFDVTNGLWN